MNISKRAFIVLLGMAYSSGLFPANSITLVSPNSGVNLKFGQNAHIHWTFTGYPDNTLVRIVLWQNGVKKGNIAVNVPIHASQYTAGNGGYMWMVGNYEGGPAAAECGYAINVRVQDSSGENSMSSQPFCIVNQGQGSIQVAAPNGGEKYYLGAQEEIRWTSSGLTGNVKIRLRGASGGMDRAIANSVPISDGKFVWKVGDLLDPHPDLTGPVSGLKVVVETLNGDFSDESDETFQVVNAVTPVIVHPRAAKWIKLQKPAADATFHRIGACDIAWTFSDSLKGKKAKLSLIKANGSTQMVIEPKVPLNIDDYHWNIPGIGILPAGDYSVRLQSIDFPDVFGDSGIFHVTAYTHQLDIHYSFTPIITNKGRYHMHRDSKNVFIVAPEGLEFADPGPSCCRIGWTNRCEDEWNVNWIYRSHLALNVSKIPASAQILNARLTWTESGSNPTAIHLYKLTAPWDGDLTALFSIPCTAINPNDGAQMKAVVQEWLNQPDKNYGLVFVGADESMNCSHAKASIHVICNLKLEVEARMTVVD
jgi:hypothetical protein